MKWIFLLCIFCSCDKPAEIEISSTNSEFKVGKLFTHEGITIYRFYDGGRAHYFSSTGEVINQQRYVRYLNKNISVYYEDENINNALKL